MPKRRSKYGAKKMKLDGHTFDSKREADYYAHLKLRKRAGEIKDFTLQPKFTLQEGFKKDGKTFRKISYIADFRIEHVDGTIENVDVKGMETKEFSIKRKLYERLYDEKLSVITYNRRFGGWIELDDLKKLNKG
ncbi:DUF1064 domain-containing protein [Salimicrobium album]|uniref:DUF1064 domain-containing protein n=1 Tax=Salimicrobium album TaxID=50717 RepID=A0A1H3D7E8_9BACI|nr:DUF1064 domain-containing protein [Salimicrobium album]SDX62058.1 Protein of unknown function [Salimicrobium album]